MRASWLIAALGIVLLPSAASAAPDYAPESDAWNGLSALLALAEREGVAVEPVSTLDLAELSAADGLLLIYPTAHLPVSGLLGFLRAGGRVALADDFGSGGALLERFAIRRAPPPVATASRLRGNPALLLARPRGFHPLTDGVDALVTNHPIALSHPELEPVFAFDDEGREALVLSGSVGEGKLVAVGDPSLFINRMMSLDGNSRFASDLLRFLGEGGGRVFLVSGDAALGGAASPEPEGTPFEQLDALLRRIASADVPATGLGIAALVLCGIFAAFAAGFVSLREPYDAKAMLPPSRDGGGFSGWLRFYLDHSQNLLHPTLMYKHELEVSLSAALGLPAEANAAARLAGLSARRLPPAARDDGHALLAELLALEAEERVAGPSPRVTAKGFIRIRERGEALLRALGAGDQDR
jgi:hypothetical protein